MNQAIRSATAMPTNRMLSNIASNRSAASRSAANRLRRALCWLMLLLSAGPLAAAELTPAMSAEQVAAEAYARMRAGDWTSAAEAFDSAALKQFRDMMAPMLEGPVGEAMAGMFFGTGSSGSDLAKMNDAAFFAGFMRTVSGGTGARLDGQEILGKVAEGPDRLHLVTRATAEAMGVRMTQMEVVTLNRTPLGWRLALSGELEGMAQALRRANASAPGTSTAPATDP
jgi:hypothetical protein